MDSTNTQSGLPPPPYTDEKVNTFSDEKVKSSAASVKSVSTADTLVDNDTHFKHGRSLLINARGIRAIRLPIPSSELEIPIHDSNGNLVYMSTREKKCSGDAVLSSPKVGELISTSYTFGPNRNPVIKQLQFSELKGNEIQATGKWTSRSTGFTTPDDKSFEWSYVRSPQPSGKKTTLLVLTRKDNGASHSGQRIAQLVRTDETRSQGSSKHSAGNGGELMVDENAVESIEESLIVATCLLMLKKEIDRRRLIQAAILAGGVGGGS